MEINTKREEIRRRGKALRDLLVDPAGQPAYTAYRKIEYDLGIQRDNMSIHEEGDMLLVQNIDGYLDIRFHNKQADTIALSKVRRFTYTPFKQFYLTNSIQTGKSATILVGRTELFTPSLELAHIYHNEGDAELFDSVGLGAGDLLTHFQIETTGYNTLMILADTTAQTTWYPQFSPNGTDWYDYCDSAGTPIQYTVNNAKKAIAINDCQAKYVRVVVYANAAATVSGNLSLQS